MSDLSAVFFGAVVALGVASLLVFVAVLLYALNGLRRSGRVLRLISVVIFCAFALTRPGAFALALVCSVVVLAQSLSYAYFAARTLLLPRVRGRVWSSAPPSVTVAIPAKNESAIIDATLRSLDRLEHPREQLELVLIDDGSTDGTAAIATARALKMRHRLRVVSHVSSGGKARRLNELVRTLASRFVLVLDADHWVEPDLIARLLGHFEGATDVGCVQAASAVRNAGASVLSKMLEMEYQFRCRAIYPGKRMGIFLGSGGMFETSALLDVGGFDADMLTEDTEISYRLYESGKRVVYDDSILTRDLAPTDFRNFFNQRHRWMRGLWQAMLAHGTRAGRDENRLSRGILAYFVQFTCDGFGALCLCVLEALVAARALGWVSLAGFWIVPVYALLGSSGLAFVVGALRSRRPLNVPLVPLLPVYIVLHTVPMAWALVDSYLLGKAMLWVKTERPLETNAPEPERPSAPLASGRV